MVDKREWEGGRTGGTGIRIQQVTIEKHRLGWFAHLVTRHTEAILLYEQ